MQTSIQKWGNSLAVRIPKTFAEGARMSAGTVVEMTLEEGKIVIAPRTQPEYTLEELLKDVTKQNLHAETDLGEPAGREAW